MKEKKSPLNSLRQSWRDALKKIQEGFPSPWKENLKDQFFENTFKQAIREANNLKHNRHYEGSSALKSYLGVSSLPCYEESKATVLEEHISSHRHVIYELIKFFVGMPNWGHPLTMCNVNPPANIASIVGASLGKLFNPDIMEGEYSWNVASTEIESGAILAKLMDWDPEKSGGIYTFGGTGAYLYALKLAIVTVLGRRTRYEGIREEGQLLVAETGHYAKETCTDWSGLGMNNYRKIAVDAENRMDIDDLKLQMKQCAEEGKPIVMIVATIGTTDAFAIDSIKEIRELIDSYENAKGYPKPFLYADAVIGWPWMTYKNYDFAENPLEFSPKALKIIKKNFDQIRHLPLADAMGIDFHKTGWAPYNSSFFLVKDYQKCASLLGRDCPPYLQYSTHYNPFSFTLETTRGADGALAGWASLKFFGYTGFRVMMGKMIEITLFLRQLLRRETNMVCINPDNYGFVTLFRVYPREINAKVQYEKEQNDPSYRTQLRANNTLQKMVAHKLFEMLRNEEKKIPGWENPPYTSFTEGISSFLKIENQEHCLVHGLKAFPISPFSNELSVLLIRNYTLKARDLVIDELIEKYAHDSKNDIEHINQPFDGDEKELQEKELYNYLLAVKPHSTEEVKPVIKNEAEEWMENSPPRLKFVAKLFHKYPRIDQLMIQNIPLFFNLTHKTFQNLLERSKVETLPSDTIIFHEGSTAENVYIISQGKILIYKQVDEEELILTTLERGDVFGEMAIFEKGKRSSSAKTLEACTVIKITGGDFIDLLF